MQKNKKNNYIFNCFYKDSSIKKEEIKEISKIKKSQNPIIAKHFNIKITEAIEKSNELKDSRSRKEFPSKFNRDRIYSVGKEVSKSPPTFDMYKNEKNQEKNMKIDCLDEKKAFVAVSKSPFRKKTDDFYTKGFGTPKYTKNSLGFQSRKKKSHNSDLVKIFDSNDKQKEYFKNYLFKRFGSDKVNQIIQLFDDNNNKFNIEDKIISIIGENNLDCLLFFQYLNSK